MDATDRKILGLLQQDASLSVAEIGSRVGLSSTPCWKRIQRLEGDGVIQKRVALVDPDKLGLGVTVFVSIETGDHSQDWLAHFADVVGAMPEVMEFYRMAGDVDYMLRVVVTDIGGYDAAPRPQDRQHLADLERGILHLQAGDRLRRDRHAQSEGSDLHASAAVERRQTHRNVLRRTRAAAPSVTESAARSSP